MTRDLRGGSNRNFINEDFFKQWSEKMAYVLGFMFADGSLVDSNNSSRTYYISFASNDLQLLESVRLALSSDHKIYVTRPKIMNHKIKRHVSRTGYVFKFGNKLMYEDLIQLGMSHRKSNNMLLPKIPSMYFPFFLRGYFDGDGCINLYRYKETYTYRLRVIFTSGSTIFLSSLATLLNQLLRIKKPKYYKSVGSYNLIINNSDALTVLRYIYSNLERAPYLGRKYDKYLGYILSKN